MMSDVGQVARNQIVQRHHQIPLAYQAVGHVATNETGPAGNKNSHFSSYLRRQRDGETEGQRDGETERRRDGETKDEMKPLSVPLSLPLSVSLPLSPSISLSSSPDSSIFKSRLFDRLWVQQVAPVNERLRVHHFAYLIEVQVAELFPLGDDDDGVAIFGERHRVGGVLDLEFGVLAAADVIGDRVVSLHARAHLDQLRRDIYRGGVSQVVLTRFEGH